MRQVVPEHVALIMDGNGRWAKQRGMPRLAGHRKGAQVLKEIAESCSNLGVRYLTVYAFSSENWKRPATEVRGLLALLEHYLDQEENFWLERDVRLRVIGDRERLPPSLQERIDRVEKMGLGKKGLFFQIAFGYGGRAEIVRATRLLLEDLDKEIISRDELTEDLFATYLYTADMPDPDLLIRTGGDQRISNYLLWQMAYTELVFLEKYWPDFTQEDLLAAFDVYGSRERRFGLAS